LAYSHSTITPISAQQNGGSRRPQAHLDWNTPREARTPRSEFAFMARYSLICGTQPQGPFGPVGAVTSATLYSSSFATQVGEASTLIPKIAAGEVAPTPAVLRHFGLEADGQGYVWSPQ
jgi:hypothetical protein